MLGIRLEPQTEKVWLGENPLPAVFPEARPPLLHQWRTYRADKPLIVNTYNTGTGKTRAALLRLYKRACDKGKKLNSIEDNALLIAPTNELLAQHKKDAEEFCQKAGLPYRVIQVSRESLDDIMKIPGFSEGEMRRGAALNDLIRNHLKMNDALDKKANLVVVNPDIFYYVLYFRYGRHDRLPLFQAFFDLFNYIIIDEFHYYNAKQLANFLFFMQISKHYGYMGEAANRQICLLTATPGPQVKKYLENLEVGIDWITPDSDSPAETEMIKETQALAPVDLQLFNAEELDEGLIDLVRAKRQETAALVNSGYEGAIISGALWRVNHIFNILKPALGEAILGRLTGAETHAEREATKGKRLILATPTVDIGYNFDRPGKTRQNIDFLLLDARSSDEFIQRLGRAGRVLGKPEWNTPSQVMAVISPDFYRALKPYDGQILSRSKLRELAEVNLPARHALYAYIQSGAIAEAFLPIYRLESMVAAEEKDDLEELFESLRRVFGAGTDMTYQALRRATGGYIRRDGFYNRLENIPSAVDDRLAACKEALTAEQIYRKSHHQNLWQNKYQADEWLQQELRYYYVEKARFSFREYFQSPQALISDSRKLLSGGKVSLYDALHIAKNYKATYFKSLKEWEQKTGNVAPEGAKEALVFCDLIKLREPGERLQIGLELDDRDYTRREWERKFTCRLTALFGLKVIALKGTLDSDVLQTIFAERYVPVLVVAEDSRSSSQLWNLSRQGQVFPYKLQVQFNDAFANYFAVPGTVALQVFAELTPTGCLVRDRHKIDAGDDRPLIC